MLECCFIFLISLIAIFVVLFLVGFVWALLIIKNIFFSIAISTSRDVAPYVAGEKVGFKALDGINIDGYFVYGKDSGGKTIIFCHEVGAGCESWYKYVSFLPEAGYNVLSFDFRGHGESGLNDGYKPNQWATQYENDDILGALEYLKSRNDVDVSKLGLIGISRGSGIGICAAYETGIIKAIVADSAYSTSETLGDYIDRWVPIYFPFKNVPVCLNKSLREVFLLFAKFLIKYKLLRMEKCLRKLNNVPILFIHGEKDSYISVNQGRRLYSMAVSDKEFWVIPKARHNESVLLQPLMYKEKVICFFNKYIN